MHWFWHTVIALSALLGMEVFAWWSHKYVMHGWGWGWHKSHHQPRSGLFEKNDLYVVVFSSVVVVLFAIGDAYWSPLMSIATGITLYGAVYSLFHDGLVHRRWPIRWQPKSGYLHRLIQAHQMHHAVHSRDGAVSFGFLWAPPPERLRGQLRSRRARRRAEVKQGDESTA